MRWAHRCFCLFATLLPIYRVMSSFATMVSFVLAKNSLGPVDPYACPLVSQLRSHFGSSRLRTQTVFANVATDAHTHTGLYLVSVCCCLAYCVYVLLIRAYFIYLSRYSCAFVVNRLHRALCCGPHCSSPPPCLRRRRPSCLLRTAAWAATVSGGNLAPRRSLLARLPALLVSWCLAGLA